MSNKHNTMAAQILVEYFNSSICLRFYNWVIKPKAQNDQNLILNYESNKLAHFPG